MKYTLLYFDDQLANIECFKELLSGEFEVIGSQDVSLFSKFLEENNPHAILLDVHMPVLDGHALYQKIKAHPLYNDCPVLFISGDESDENVLKSLEGGGIDFLPRNLSTEEITIRIKNKVKFFIERSTSLEIGNLELNLNSMKASVAGETLDLTLLEFRILSWIMRYFPRFLTREEMILKVWGKGSVKPGTINTHLTNLKPKIEKWDYKFRFRGEKIIVQKKDDF
ncbi:MAG: response regulator transcription factor [Bacteriovoracia bacterium]